MLYTPQQLSGGAGYSKGVRVGNWQEDSSAADDALAKFAKKKASGNLAINHEQRKHRTLHQQVPHSFGATLQDGFSVQLQSVATGKIVTGNIFQLLEFGSSDSAVFTSAVNEVDVAEACNTVVVTRANGDKNGGPILFGEAVYIKGNPSLLVDERTGMLRGELFLNCDTSGGVVGGSARRSVCMTKNPAKTCLWTIMHTDLSKKVKHDGTPVVAGEPVAIVHVVSGLKLATSAVFSGASGDEVFGASFKGSTRSQNLQKENLFIIKTSSDRNLAEDNRKFVKMSPDAVLKIVKNTINQRGSYAIRGIGRSFRIMDDGGDGMLDHDDFRFGLQDYGVHLSDSEFKCLVQAFDENGDGLISFDEFLVNLRGPLSARRKNFISQAFAILDNTGDGRVTLADIQNVYNARDHPEVKAGKKTEKEVLQEFMRQWDKEDPDGIITADEFFEYYKDVSASIDDDDYFELMMRNSWHISGGEGWCQNTANRRVLVIHSDGSQEVTEIKNDLGLEADDIAGMIERLKKQGVQDIAKVELYG
jgi:Ca2+-binding EF-hand superfamily protein